MRALYRFTALPISVSGFFANGLKGHKRIVTNSFARPRDSDGTWMFSHQRLIGKRDISACAKVVCSKLFAYTTTLCDRVRAKVIKEWEIVAMPSGNGKLYFVFSSGAFCRMVP
jgi:hypothetical protein